MDIEFLISEGFEKYGDYYKYKSDPLMITLTTNNFKDGKKVVCYIEDTDDPLHLTKEDVTDLVKYLVNIEKRFKK